jgi:hypothetical protein
MRIRTLVLLAFILGHAAVAQEFWEKKPYTEWSKPETEKILENSPWAQHITLSHLSSNLSGISTTSRGVTGVGTVTQNIEAEHSQNPTLTYTAQLRSARPIRQAVVRQRQLQDGYDSMSPVQRAALDAKTNAYLAQPQGEIVVYVTYTSSVNSYADLMRRYWTQQTYDLLKNTVFLSIGHERLSPTGYAATTGAFQFNFPRPAEIPTNGSMVLEFRHPGVGVIAPERALIEFKLNKLVFDNAPAI